MMPNQEVESGRKACNWGMRYLGVIGQGKVVFIEDQREKIKALDLIMEKYAGKQKFGSISKYTIGIINRTYALPDIIWV